MNISRSKMRLEAALLEFSFATRWQLHDLTTKLHES